VLQVPGWAGGKAINENLPGIGGAGSSFMAKNRLSVGAAPQTPEVSLA